MAKRKNMFYQSKPIWLTLLGLVGLGLLISVLLQGKDVALFNPKGVIAKEQLRLLIFSVVVLLQIAIPTLAVFYFVAWKYRESNEKAVYKPLARTSYALVIGMWLVPSISMIILAAVMWPATHRLAPQKLIDNGVKPLTIQVVALRWKWLFIYPEQNIATVNYVQIPANIPVQFKLTADESPMSSFWIPHLGGQLYAMTGHVNQLNLMADTLGDYGGSSAEINGPGFAGMKFITRVSSIQDFDDWTQKVKLSNKALDASEYQSLLTPSENNKAVFYSNTEPDLYDNKIMKYGGSHENNMEHQ